MWGFEWKLELQELGRTWGGALVMLIHYAEVILCTTLPSHYVWVLMETGALRKLTGHGKARW